MPASKDPKPVTASEYKGHPLVRSGDTLYYGSMSDKYVACLRITEKKPFADLNGANPVMLPSRVLVELMYTDPNVKTKDRIIKKSEKKSLYVALDIAQVWLDRALQGKI